MQDTVVLVKYMCATAKSSYHVGPIGLLLISFLNPPFFCSGTPLDSGENEDGTWLISVLDAGPPLYELSPPTELFVGSEGGGGVSCGM